MLFKLRCSQRKEHILGRLLRTLEADSRYLRRLRLTGFAVLGA